MSVYATLTIIKKNGEHEDIFIKSKDMINHVGGGMVVKFGKGTTIFFPYHRIWQYQEIRPTSEGSDFEKDNAVDSELAF